MPTGTHDASEAAAAAGADSQIEKRTPPSDKDAVIASPDQPVVALESPKPASPGEPKEHSVESRPEVEDLEVEEVVEVDEAEEEEQDHDDQDMSPPSSVHREAGTPSGTETSPDSGTGGTAGAIVPAAAVRMANGAAVLSMAAARQIMLDQYTPWVMSTYGDSAKTKTITTRKYARIVALLKSHEKERGESGGGGGGGSSSSTPGLSSSEAAKFRLWVKSKGFHLGPPAGHPDYGKLEHREMLYLPTGTDKSLDGKVHFVYKKVAMVEQFFDIIYSVHVEAAGDTQLRGRAGKHCGQKRTYRAVADQFAFIPREAISKFLLYCIDCQRKNSMEHRQITGANGHQVALRRPETLRAGSGLDLESGGLSSTPSVSSVSPPSVSVSSVAAPAAAASTPAGGVATSTSQPEYRPPSPAPSLVEQLSSVAAASSSSPFRSVGHVNGSPAPAGVATALNLSPPNTPSSSTSSSLTAPVLTPSAAAALSQAMAAMQSMNQISQGHSLRSLQMRNSILASANQNPLLATQAAALLGGGNSAFSPTAGLFSNAQTASLLSSGAAGGAAVAGTGSEIDMSLPITSNYLRRMRALGLVAGLDPAYRNAAAIASSTDKDESAAEGTELATSTEETPAANTGRNSHRAGSQLSALLSQQSTSVSPGLSDHATGENSSTAPDDNSSISAKDEDDEDNDEDEDDAAAGGDPEKLKAFNMFVRLFVDENLDRMVPISRQPKEKIQAIIDSCTRQFPEHATRARKRIRTYLKACRRNKRTRDQAGLDNGGKQSAPHLTSIQAEQLLARACENEAENAKRMRMGLEPVSQPMPVLSTATSASGIDVLASAAASSTFGGVAPTATVFSGGLGNLGLAEKQLKSEYKSEQLATLLAASQPVCSVSPAAAAAVTAPHAGATLSAFVALNGNNSAGLSNGIVVNGANSTNGTLFRPAFGAAATPPITATTAAVNFPGTQAILQQQQQLAATSSANGSSFDAMKKAPLLSHKLNTTEIGAVRQLITGYRESAAFLLRSADELEHLLQIQPKL